MTIKQAARGVFALALLFISSPPGLGETMSESKAIQATIDQNSDAVARQDIAGVLATYESSAVMVGQQGMQAKGSPALQKMFEGFFTLKPKLSFKGHESIIAGDIAVHLNSWTMQGTLPDGNTFHDSGLSVVVLRKQADGKWLMVIDNPFGDSLLKKK